MNNKQFALEERKELFAGLERACEAFPPLLELLDKLADIEGDGRADLDRLILAIHEFMQKIDLPSRRRPGQINGEPLRLLTDLIYALNDLNEGKQPPLFKRQNLAPNKNTKTSDAAATDLLIASRRYLIQSLKRQGESNVEKQAESILARSLKARGVSVDAKDIHNLCRTHNRGITRKGQRSDGFDLRNRQIDSDAEFRAALDQIAHLMKQTQAPKPPR